VSNQQDRPARFVLRIPVLTDLSSVECIDDLAEHEQ
jgi:hypothetical protein